MLQLLLAAAALLCRSATAAPPRTDIKGTVGSHFMGPSGLTTWLPCKNTERDLCSTETAPACCNLWWLRDDDWGHYTLGGAADWSLFSYNFAAHPNASVIINFPAYAADPRWAGVALQRLNVVVADVTAAGLNAIVFVARPEFHTAGTGGHTHDVVHNLTARAYLIARIEAIAALPAVAANVRLVSVYWMGAASYCKGATVNCSAADITSFSGSLQAAVHRVFPAGSKFLAHVDGPWWDGCTASACPNWIVNGYSPASLAGLDGLLAESWVQGSLERGVAYVLSTHAFTTSNILLMCDVPDCDMNNNYPCSTGSVDSDTASWYKTLDTLGLTGTWAVWQFVDGGLKDLNAYGDALNDGSGLSKKGNLHRARAAADAEAVALKR